jgi:hypothetical protein
MFIYELLGAGSLRGAQLVKKLPAFYGTRRFTAVFTRARHRSLWHSFCSDTNPLLWRYKRHTDTLYPPYILLIVQCICTFCCRLHSFTKSRSAYDYFRDFWRSSLFLDSFYSNLISWNTYLAWSRLQTDVAYQLLHATWRIIRQRANLVWCVSMPTVQIKLRVISSYLFLI